MAEEYSKSACAWLEDREPLDERDIQQAYLAGLKAGRPQWHKVADGDLPLCKKGDYTINVLTDCGDIAYYNYNLDCWIVES